MIDTPSSHFPPLPADPRVQRARRAADVSRLAGEPVVACVGTFDGVHRGHQEILARARATAHKLNRPLWAVSFHPHPKTIVRPGAVPGLLTEPEERIALLGAFGADGVLMLPFDDDLARTSAAEFADSVLAQGMNAETIVVGADFGFGQGRGGDAAFLSQWGQEKGINVEIVELVGDTSAGPGKTISSSIIRNAMTGNEFESAIGLLGHAYPITGQVVPGAGLGRKIGYPTWNLSLSDSKLAPPVGVYAAWTARESSQPAMVYYGARPTFAGQTMRLEVHVLGTEEDYPPRQPSESVWLTHFVRAEMALGDAAGVARQLAIDEQVIRSKLLITDVLNGT
jgi:riboflavin kinase/FMN adenylyltransferase